MLFLQTILLIQCVAYSVKKKKKKSNIPEERRQCNTIIQIKRIKRHKYKLGVKGSFIANVIEDILLYLNFR